MTLVPRKTFVALALLCIAAVGAALFTQYAWDMQPCPWCILQRLIFVLIAAVSLIGLVWRSRVGTVATAVLVDLLAAGGVASQYTECAGRRAGRGGPRRCAGRSEPQPCRRGTFPASRCPAFSVRHRTDLALAQCPLAPRPCGGHGMNPRETRVSEEKEVSMTFGKLVLCLAGALIAGGANAASVVQATRTAATSASSTRRAGTSACSTRGPRPS